MANIYVGGMIWCDLHWSNKVDISFCYESQTISDSVLISLHYLDSIFNQTYHYLISYILHSPFPLNLTNRKNDSITFCTSCYGIIFLCVWDIYFIFIHSLHFISHPQFHSSLQSVIYSHVFKSFQFSFLIFLTYMWFCEKMYLLFCMNEFQTQYLHKYHFEHDFFYFT